MDGRIADTYRYVRIITPLPAAWLLTAIVAVACVRHQLLDSLSDYYAGPLRDVFVGALMASGVGMIAFKGSSKLEDYALNFAGVNGFVVALVSNSFQSVLDTTRAAESHGLPVLVGSDQLLQNLRISVLTFLAALVAFVVADVFVMHWTRFRWSGQTRGTNVLVVVSWLGEGVLLLAVLAMVLGVTTVATISVFSLVHFTAAALLIVNLSFAAASHAFPSALRKDRVDEPAADRAVQTVFRAITALMWVGLAVGVVLIWRRTPYATIGVEVWEILLFLVFWFRATEGEWRRGVRSRVGSASSGTVA